MTHAVMGLIGETLGILLAIALVYFAIVRPIVRSMNKKGDNK